MKKLSLNVPLPYLEVLFWFFIACCFFLFPDRLQLASQMLIMGLFAVSLDIALGYAGILTVGHAAFFGIGAYTAGLLSAHGWSEPISGLFIALLVTACIGYLLSFFIVRGADLTRLMITIGICVMLAELANQLSRITGGTDGLQGMEIAPLLGQFEFDLYGKTAFIYTFIVVLFIFMIVRRILRSPFGLALKGIHGNKKRMQALGVPIEHRLKIAYCFSAGVAGISGALLAQTTQFVGIESLSLNLSTVVLIMLVLGGAGRLYGGMIGAIIYMCIHEIFADMNPEYWMFWLGLFLIVSVMLGRNGILGTIAHVITRRKS